METFKINDEYFKRAEDGVGRYEFNLSFNT